MENLSDFAQWLHNQDIIQVREIPRPLMRAMADPLTGNHLRFVCFTYLVNQGVAPEIAGRVITYWVDRGMVQPQRMMTIRRHVQQMVREAYNANFDTSLRQRYFGGSHYDIEMEKYYKM